MATYQIPIRLNVVGRAPTEQQAQTEAERKYKRIIQAICASYGFTGTVLNGMGQPTGEAVDFSRQQVRSFLQDVVQAWQRTEALRQAEEDLVLEEIEAN